MRNDGPGLMWIITFFTVNHRSSSLLPRDAVTLMCADHKSTEVQSDEGGGFCEGSDLQPVAARRRSVINRHKSVRLVCFDRR